MRNIVTSAIVIFTFIQMSFGQNADWCGTPYTQQAAQWRTDHAYLNNLVNKNSRTTYYIPIRFHVFGLDAGTGYFQRGKILEIMDKVNKDFAPVGFHFYLAGKTSYIAKDNDIDRIPNSYFYNGQYSDRNELFVYNDGNVYNAYIVGNYPGLCGRANFPGDVGGKGDGGIELIKTCLTANNTTFAHETGHWLSLPHPFSGWEWVNWSCGNVNDICDTSILNCWAYGVEYVNSQPLGNSSSVYNCEISGDGFCDTKPDYFFQRWGYTSCSNDCPAWKDPDGIAIDPDPTLYMSYASDVCSNRFSNEQINGNSQNAGMIATLLSNDRKWLLNFATPPTSNVSGTEQFLVPYQNDTIPYHKFQFSWTPVPGATLYHFQISRSLSWSETYSKVDVYTPDNFYKITRSDSLTIGQKYYWRVKPFNAVDYSANYAMEGTAYNRIFYAADSNFVNNTDSTYIYPAASPSISTNNSVRIFPNPCYVNKNMYVELFIDKPIAVNCKLFDISGRLLKSQSLIFSQNKSINDINLKGLSQGVYFLKIISSEFAYENKIVVVD